MEFVKPVAVRPDALFELLADPRGCETWHVHPVGVEVDRVDAGLGLALEGAEFTTHGRVRGIPYRGRTFVSAARRPSLYAVEHEVVIDHPRALVPRTHTTERYAIERAAFGSSVRYETQVWREWRSDLFGLLFRALQAVYDRFGLQASALRKCNTELLEAAERVAPVKP